VCFLIFVRCVSGHFFLAEIDVSGAERVSSRAEERPKHSHEPVVRSWLHLCERARACVVAGKVHRAFFCSRT
jgi:hypothetical protein